MTPMVVVVTGASGHIGANLVRALLKEKRQVRVLVHNDRKGIEGLDVEEVQGDIKDPYTLYRAFAGADVVYHLAALTSWSSTDWTKLESVNVIGTRNVVEACLQCNVRRLIHFSSIGALTQEPLDTPIDESRPLADTEDCPPYNRSKAAGEREVRQGIELGLDSVILNPTGVIGPYDCRQSYFGELLLALARGRLPALIDSGFDWVDARDIASGAIRAETEAPTGAKYIISGNWASIRDLAHIIEDIAGTQAPRFTLPTWVGRTGAPVVTALNQISRNRINLNNIPIGIPFQINNNINRSRATRELGYQPRLFRNTLIDTFRWFQKAGMLDKSIKLKSETY
jgi:dihydroflavonol-4-reductase